MSGKIAPLWQMKPRREDLANHGLEPALPRHLAQEYPRAAALFVRLRQHPAFAVDLEPHLAKLEAGVDALGA